MASQLYMRVFTILRLQFHQRKLYCRQWTQFWNLSRLIIFLGARHRDPDCECFCQAFLKLIQGLAIHAILGLFLASLYYYTMLLTS